LLSQLVLMRPINITHLLLINAQVWQGNSLNCQSPHLLHRLTSLSGTVSASTMFFIPTAPHEVHW